MPPAVDPDPAAPSPERSVAAEAAAPDTLDGLSYEQARSELEDVVRRLEASDLPLDDLMALWERGEALAGVCEARLAGARSRLDAVRAARSDGDGEPG